MSAGYDGARVLITGARGFLGTHLSRVLLAEGAEVHGVTRHSASEDTGAVRWWQSELQSPSEVDRLVDAVDPEVVFHLSGLVSASPAPEMVLPSFESLLAVTVRLLLSLNRVKVRRVVLVGSLTEPPVGAGFVTPGSPYVAAKVAASAYGRMFHQLYHIPVTVVRPGFTYGPGQPSERLLPYVIATLMRGEAPQLTSGRFEADWIYVRDVVEGLRLAGQVADLDGLTLDLGTGTSMIAREVVSRLTRIFREDVGQCLDPVFGALPDRPAERVHEADVEFVADRMGWSAVTSLDDGLRETLRWYSSDR